MGKPDASFSFGFNFLIATQTLNLMGARLTPPRLKRLRDGCSLAARPMQILVGRHGELRLSRKDICAPTLIFHIFRVRGSFYRFL